jgi:uncharacterized protein (DUF433 family)
MTTHLPHLTRDSSGVIWIDESGYRVLDLVREHLAHGWSAEILQENHPDLSLAQIHAALAWYYDHEDEMHAEMLRRETEANTVFSGIPESPLLKRLRAIKALRR